MASRGLENNPAEAAIAKLRAVGEERVDPVRFRFIEALAERSAVQPSAVQAVLAHKLARALADYQQRCSAAMPMRVPCPAPVTPHSPLADLVRLLGAADETSPASTDAVRDAVAGSQGSSSPHPVLVELRTLQQDRSEWKRLHVQQLLARSLAQVPDNPGPLNSQLLLLRALQRLQTLSSGYLEAFISQVETLQWLAEASSVTPDLQLPLTRLDAERKELRKRPGHKSKAS